MMSSSVWYLTLAVVLLSLNTERGLALLGCSSEIIINASAVLNGSQQVSTHTLSGDLQLLIPAWRMNEMGYVNLWEAVVQGNATTSAIEFQIFQPHPEKNGVYNVIYGNRYNEQQPGRSQIGNRVIIPVETVSSPQIPVRPGYVVGIRLRNNTDPNFGLQYINITSGVGGVDVYYWKGMGSQTCNLSLCDSNAGVLRGVIPLVSWRFCVRSLFEFEIVNTVFFEVYLVLTPFNCLQATTPSCPKPTTTSVHHTSLQLASPPTPSPFLLTTPVTASPGLSQIDCSTEIITNSTAVLNGSHQLSPQILRGDLQLLIPAWKLNEMGFVNLWEAVVQGNATTSAIEFQIFQPHPEKNGVYNLVYGNQYDKEQPTHSQIGKGVSIPVGRALSLPKIPVRPGYIIGIRLRNNTDPNFGLQYINVTSGAGGVDVYYWEGMGNQICNLSVCDSDARVLHGVIPQVSWRFCVRESLSTEDIIFKLYLGINPLNCLQPAFTSCPGPTITVQVHSKSLLSASSTILATTNPDGIEMASTSSLPDQLPDLSTGNTLTVIVTVVSVVVTLIIIVVVSIVLIAILTCVKGRHHKQRKHPTSSRNDQNEIENQPEPDTPSYSSVNADPPIDVDQNVAYNNRLEMRDNVCYNYITSSRTEETEEGSGYSYAYVPEDVQHRAHSLAMIMMQNIAYGAESSNRIQ